MHSHFRFLQLIVSADRCVVYYFTANSTSSSLTTSSMSNSTISSASIIRFHGRAEMQGYKIAEAQICSHLCLMSRSGPQCACTTGYWLKSNGSCVPGTFNIKPVTKRLCMNTFFKFYS